MDCKTELVEVVLVYEELQVGFASLNLTRFL